MNWAVNGAEFNLKGLAQFGIGAASGALGAGIGSGVSAALAGSSFGAGFMGNATTMTTGFFNGALSGMAGGAASGFVGGAGGAWIAGGNSFQDIMKAGAIGAGLGAASGAVTGGIWGGIDAAKNGARFWDGATVTDNVLVDKGYAFVQQNGEMNCGPASSESLSQGAHTKADVRASLGGGDVNTKPLSDVDLWNDFGARTGRIAEGPFSGENNTINSISGSMQGGADITFNSNITNSVGHSVVANRVTERTVTKLSGNITKKLLLHVMDPARGQYVSFSHSQVRNSRIFIIK